MRKACFFAFILFITILNVRSQQDPPQAQVKDITQTCTTSVDGAKVSDACQAFKDCCKSQCAGGKVVQLRCESTGTVLPGTQVCTCPVAGASGLVACAGTILAMVALLQLLKM